MKFILRFLLLSCFLYNYAYADLKVLMFNVNSGKNVGFVVAKDSKRGLLLIPYLFNLPPGIHGFHVHNSPSCAAHAMSAGGHLDPVSTGKHLGPYDFTGHLGDLPALTVKQNGTVNTPVLAPRLTLKMIENHSLMIHAGGDNYSDSPEANGGGGARIACGIIPKK